MENYPIALSKTMEALTAAIIAEASNYQRTLMVIDEQVDKIYHHFIESLMDKGYSKLVIPSGEASKSEKMLFNMLSELAQQGFTRKDWVIAIGGGVVGDLVGFAASIYMRGIDWATVPTTLLSQVDSSVGGKTAINLPEGKNLVGSFYHPKAVWLCPVFLKTLSDAEFLSGIGELIKYAYLADYTMLADIKDLVDNRQYNWELCEMKLSTLVEKAIAIKLAVVTKDFKENHERKFLNLGHSFGHAIESLEGYKVPHGICVAHGIWWILAMDAKTTGSEIAIERLDAYEALLDGLGISRTKSYETQALLTYILRDKKTHGQYIDLIRVKGCRLSETDYSQPESIIKALHEQCCIQTMTISELEAGINTITLNI